jgi:putative copper export protein
MILQVVAAAEVALLLSEMQEPVVVILQPEVPEVQQVAVPAALARELPGAVWQVQLAAHTVAVAVALQRITHLGLREKQLQQVQQAQ